MVPQIFRLCKGVRTLVTLKTVRSDVQLCVNLQVTIVFKGLTTDITAVRSIGNRPATTAADALMSGNRWQVLDERCRCNCCSSSCR
uniref:Putative secreted protein n=1 Tax=Anopheles darlingi TaxID=43151 RepID=A0A2M4DLL2_ANODA